MTWHVNIMTLFPDCFPGPLGVSILDRALQNGLWSYRCVSIRETTPDKHGRVDDTPYGGGAGMVLRPDCLEAAFLTLPSPGRRIYLSPRGPRIDQEIIHEFAAQSPLTLLCGRYEGVDERFLQAYDFEEYSIGDYVLAGGEVAAMAVIESCLRLLPGVLGNEMTTEEESFSGTQKRLEYPQYTRPASWITASDSVYNVPDILRSGDHGAIEKWRCEQSEIITRERRPDLIPDNAKPSKM